MIFGTSSFSATLRTALGVDYGSGRKSEHAAQRVHVARHVLFDVEIEDRDRFDGLRQTESLVGDPESLRFHPPSLGLAQAPERPVHRFREARNGEGVDQEERQPQDRERDP